MRKRKRQDEKSENCRARFDSLPWQIEIEGARQKAVKRGRQRLRLLQISRSFVEREWCIRGHVGYVLQGELDVDFDGHVVRFSAGDGIWIPAGPQHKHKPKAVSKVVKLFLLEDE